MARAKPGRNDACPCGSGKKYKRCCLGKPAGEQQPGRALQLMRSWPPEVRRFLSERPEQDAATLREMEGLFRSGGPLARIRLDAQRFTAALASAWGGASHRRSELERLAAGIEASVTPELLLRLEREASSCACRAGLDEPSRRAAALCALSAAMALEQGPGDYASLPALHTLFKVQKEESEQGVRQSPQRIEALAEQRAIPPILNGAELLRLSACLALIEASEAALGGPDPSLDELLSDAVRAMQGAITGRALGCAKDETLPEERRAAYRDLGRALLKDPLRYVVQAFACSEGLLAHPRERPLLTALGGRTTLQQGDLAPFEALYEELEDGYRAALLRATRRDVEARQGQEGR